MKLLRWIIGRRRTATWQPGDLREALLARDLLASLVAGCIPTVEPLRSWSIAPRSKQST